jgi:tetratricopeptide (TPR) repeat protein
MNKGDLAIEHNDMDLAMKEYSAAESMFPDNEEMKYWHAVTLANIGKVEKSLPLFKEVFRKNKNWITLTPRLIKSSLLLINKENLELILNQAD